MVSPGIIGIFYDSIAVAVKNFNDITLLVGGVEILCAIEVHWSVAPTDCTNNTSSRSQKVK